MDDHRRLLAGRTRPHVRDLSDRDGAGRRAETLDRGLGWGWGLCQWHGVRSRASAEWSIPWRWRGFGRLLADRPHAHVERLGQDLHLHRGSGRRADGQRRDIDHGQWHRYPERQPFGSRGKHRRVGRRWNRQLTATGGSTNQNGFAGSGSGSGAAATTGLNGAAYGAGAFSTISMSCATSGQSGAASFTYQ